MDKKEKRQGRPGPLRAVIVIICIAVAVALLLRFVFVVKDVEITGNELYPDETIEKVVLDDELSWNSLYVYVKYKFFKDVEAVPFVESMEISMKSPQTLEISVFEKGIIGYAYVPSLKKNVYFDKDGIVVEISDELIENVPAVSGFSIGQVSLYQTLPITDKDILDSLLTATQMLQKYELMPDLVYVDDSKDLWMTFGDIDVNLGANVYMNEKVLRLNSILPQLEGMVGILHLDTWTPDYTDVYFSQQVAVADSDEETTDEPVSHAKDIGHYIP